MRAKGAGGVAGAGTSGWSVWRRRSAVPDEAELWLDLAAFADGGLGARDRKRVEALLREDPDAATDVAAARALGRGVALSASGATMARAIVLFDQQTRVVQPETAMPGSLQLPRWRGAASWSSLAAAVVLAGWLGFGLGSGMLEPSSGRLFEDAMTGGSLDAAPALVRDFNEGWQT